MAKLTIQTGKKNDILRTISTPVKSDELKGAIALAEDMVRYIKDPVNKWVGLAAPQVGTNKRIIAVALMQTSDDENYKFVGMINPVITEHSEETCVDAEGCLSVPGEFGDVSRYKKIKLEYLDLKGKPMTLILSNFTARIVQHEIDHLDWVLFTDKIIKKEKKGKVE